MHRKKLTLLPRSSEHHEATPPSASSVDESKSKANPFGDAKPVDTLSVLKKVEEKLAKEKEHKEEPASTKARDTSTSSPASPTTQRPEKGRSHPKQLLRRAPANPAPQGQSGISGPSQVDTAAATKAEAQVEATTEEPVVSWRKEKENKNVAVAAPQEETGWETVPARGRKVNGVAAKH